MVVMRGGELTALQVTTGRSDRDAHSQLDWTIVYIMRLNERGSSSPLALQTLPPFLQHLQPHLFGPGMRGYIFSFEKQKWWGRKEGRKEKVSRAQ